MSKSLFFKREYVSYAAVLSVGLLLSAIAASASTTISTNIATGGNITTAAAYGLDTSAAGALNIGTTTATSVIIGSSTANVGIASSSPYVALGVTGTTTSSAGMVIGSAGTPANLMLFGNCALIISAGAGATVNATSTSPFDCSVTGVLPGDKVLASFATSTASSPRLGVAAANGWAIVSAMASTTAGKITVMVANNTGVNAALSGSGIASTTTYLILR